MTRPLTPDAARCIVLAGALAVPTLLLLRIGLGETVPPLGLLLADLEIAGLLVPVGDTYVLTAVGRDVLAELLREERVKRRPIPVLPLAVSA
ncbi:hypothetical protein [uncultured Deinococcus sp.]|uniref:hypothetical protein n=1 Tax=uncultured Deinococcus sp. TaxID=158789 RepID=UPI0025FFA2C9|nr:hypothetical protein [uncultured Deinococcus sp.]